MIGDDMEQARKILILCLRGRWETGTLEAARAAGQAAGPGTWEAVQRLAEREGLAPLLYDVARGRELLPSTVEEELCMAYYATARENLVRFHEMDRILAALASGGLSTIVLKGTALAEAVYRNPALRPMGDLDLLLHPADVRRAIDLLSVLGYQPTGAEPHAGHQLAFENEIILTRPDPAGCPVELHWSLFDSLYYQRVLPIAWFWHTAQPLSATQALASNPSPGGSSNLPTVPGERSGLLLCPEAQLLHLCGHLALHHGAGERWRELWLHDIAEVMTCYRHEIDWNVLLDQAQACELVLPVQQVLARVVEDWQVPLPDGVPDRLRSLRPARHEQKVFRELTTPHRSVGRRFWTDLTALSGWRARFRFAWNWLLPSAGYMRQRYAIRHRWLLPAYYPYRWWVGLSGLLRARR